MKTVTTKNKQRKNRRELGPPKAVANCYTPAQVARALGVAERTVRRWIELHGLPSFRLGSARLIPLTALLEWAGSGSPPPGSDQITAMLRDAAARGEFIGDERRRK